MRAFPVVIVQILVQVGLKFFHGSIFFAPQGHLEEFLEEGLDKPFSTAVGPGVFYPGGFVLNAQDKRPHHLLPVFRRKSSAQFL